MAAAALLVVVVMQQLVWSAEAQVAVAVGTGPPPGCPDRCGDVHVPFPFGIGDGCSLPGFALTCNTTTNRPPRLMIGNTTLQVVNISLPNSTLRALDTAGAVHIKYGIIDGNGTWPGVSGAGAGGPYVVSEDNNQLLVTGCNILVTLFGNAGNVITGCASLCAINDQWAGAVILNPRDKCSGIGCCQTPIPIGRTTYRVNLTNLERTRELSGQVLEAVRIAERGWFDGVAAELLKNQSTLSDTTARIPVPVVLEWAVASTPVITAGVPQFDNASCPTPAAARKSACVSSNSKCVNVTGNYRTGYVCLCKDGYEGNPYVAAGCQDVDECKRPAEVNRCFGECINTPGSFRCWCPRGESGNWTIPGGCVKSKLGLTIGIGIGSGAGLFILALGAAFLTRKIKRQRERMLRQKFFKLNRGHLLQQLVSQNADIAEKMIITLSELEKATNNFDESRELGGGGHGTVYKGILSGLHVVAIKKSKLAIQREIDEFINEVAILSQINHRNVVKLFGCCLETEVPLLVYEFISNGTLYQHLHVEGPISLPWEDRLRIATETARALAYLHLAVAFPIIHRDIKSQNILLDGSLTTKVSDFGASRCIPAEQTGVITAIQGTLGYLDPMYYYTGRLTEKSDVYSFGVVLIELLTRKKSYSYRSQQDDSLVAHFTTLLAHDNLVDILDPQVMEEGGEEVKEVAMLAVACVKLKAEERPTMRQVEMSLESIRSSFLRQEVQHSVGKKKSMENHVIRSNMAIDGTNLETTRQYSLEEEYLLSSSILVKGDQRVMLAVACVKLKAEERSTIRQVEMSLESIRKKCNIVWARRNPCMENHVFRSSMAINGISLESTRQYSLEEKNGYQQQCPALAGDCLSGGVACTPCVGSGSAAAGAGMLSPIYPFGIGAGCARDKDFQLECINDNSNNNVSTTPRLILSIHQLQLLSLSLDDGEARALFKAKRQCYNNTDGAIVSTNDVNLNMSLSGSMAYLFSARNRLVALGCPNLGYIVHGLGIYVSGCTSICWPKQQETNTNVSLGGCNGEGCCQSRIAPSIIDYYKPFIVGLKQQDQDPILRNGLTTPCRYVFLAEDEWIQTTYRHPLNYSHENSIYNRTDDFAVPVVLDWAIRRNLHNCSTATGNMTEYACRSDNSVCIDAINTTNGVGFGYRCRCSEGYEGNPYLADGCQDIDECQRIREYPCYGECTNTPGGYECMYRHGARGNATVPQGCIVDRTNLGLIISIGVGSGVGLLAMAVGAAFLTRKIKNKRERMLRRKFFKQNRGHLLQRLVSQNADITERMIIPLAELEKATNNFDISRELGGGGHGTVYKGILSDLHVVAIKKSKVAIQREIDEFINEIAILSQINHRNVVKLFGCCLETEVPLLLKAEERPTMRQVEMKLESIRSIFWQQVQHTEGSTKSMENHVSRSNPPNNTTNVEGTRQYSLEEEYLLSSSGRDPPRLMLGNGTLQVVDISLADSTMRAVDITNYEVYATGGNGTWVGVGADADASSPYVVSETLSELLITGCNIQVTLVGGTGNVIIGCSSFCSINDMWGYGFVPTIPGDKCSGVGCCRTNITIGRPNYGVLLKRIDESLELDGEVPTSVRVAERGWFDGVANELLSRTRTDTSFHKPVPVVLEWAVASTRVVLPGMTPGNSSCPKDVGKSACRSSHSYCRNVTGNYRTGYVCRCEKGYDGNPYVVGGGGCQDINECERAEENGCFGECSNTPGGFLCRCPDGARGNANVPNGCIKSNLEKATNNFDESRELGGGGHGTVYKGILSDLHVVAIKKSKVAIQREIDEFINEKRSMMFPAATTAAAALMLLVLQLSWAEAQVGGGAARCPDRCGNVSVPFPFGIRDGCSLPGFGLTCDTTTNPPRLMLGNGTLQVTNISLADSTVRAVDLAGAATMVNGSIDANGTWAGVGIDGPYVVSETRNQLLVTGCNIQVTLLGSSSNGIIGCSAFCSISDRWTGTVLSIPGDKCSGLGCCRTPIPIGRPSYHVQLKNLDTSREHDNKVPHAVRVAERGWFDGVADELLSPTATNASLRKPVPVVLDWAVASTPVIFPGVPQFDNSSCPSTTAGAATKSVCVSSNSKCFNVTGNYRTGYVCRCDDGYEGNPYVAGRDGCHDINECDRPAEVNRCFGECINTLGSFQCRCPRGASGNWTIPGGCVKSKLGLSIGIGVGSGAGLLVIALCAVLLTRKIKNQRARIMRQKFFRQNRGHLLQQLVSQKADIAERMIIPLAELEKATNNFDESRELGGGGHGTVYKGILSDLHVVAIKKSKVAVQREIDEFINEVAILSQINHRNVVKLYGCCLETEVPLLVYEFISNGTLYHHLHEGLTSLSWEDRLRIATETARSLAYLHSAVSFPIIHRDIKSHNILLDGSLTSKVSDFGASRCIPAEKNGVTTAIQGTLGYLDPMYYYTGRLTEKSDVFSFGVVLIELLTRKKPYSYKSPKDDSLVAHFTALLIDDNLNDILDSQVKEEGGKEIKEVALLAVACVKLKAEERPTMRQVEMTLETIRSSFVQEEVLHTTSMKKSKENHVAWRYPADEGTSIYSTRQYSLEEENLLSSSHGVGCGRLVFPPGIGTGMIRAC
uniref:Protein kinase domain-containing protein n=1 Tax=Leersia perrieri TaxID=77586 RepID=A0A0D9XGS6_9ORYZ